MITEDRVEAGAPAPPTPGRPTRRGHAVRPDHRESVLSLAAAMFVVTFAGVGTALTKIHLEPRVVDTPDFPMSGPHSSAREPASP